MKEYKQIPTRIKVVKSKIQTDYWPQHKSSWISGWIDFNNFNGVHCSHATYTLDLEVGSLEWAKATIDHFLKEKKEDWEHQNNRTTEYITYP